MAPPSKGAEANFTGDVSVDRLFPANDPLSISGGYVSFAPGARTAWHTHPEGQMLIVTAGSGRVRQWGGPLLEIRQGDVVWFPAGVKHWHGAAPDASMTHIALAKIVDGKSSTWMEKVSDEQYNGQ
ncbi:MAG: cupin domain-containing protein [Candidatus Accumulibacter sp.]|nr:cupin domain-containing protein [Accumulibacter sp.]